MRRWAGGLYYEKTFWSTICLKCSPKLTETGEFSLSTGLSNQSPPPCLAKTLVLSTYRDLNCLHILASSLTCRGGVNLSDASSAVALSTSPSGRGRCEYSHNQIYWNTCECSCSDLGGQSIKELRAAGPGLWNSFCWRLAWCQNETEVLVTLTRTHRSCTRKRCKSLAETRTTCFKEKVFSTIWMTDITTFNIRTRFFTFHCQFIWFATCKILVWESLLCAIYCWVSPN